MILDDVADYLSSGGVGTRGTTLFTGALPVLAPDRAIAVSVVGGQASFHTMNASPGNPQIIEQPQIRISCRGSIEGYQGARQDAENAFHLLNGLRPRVINSVDYLWAVARSQPFLQHIDSNLRPAIGFDVDVMKKLSVYDVMVLADGAIGYWPMGEGLGSIVAADLSAYGHPGSVTGGVTFQQASGLVDGSTAALFNGTTGYISVPHDASLSPTGDLSVEAWIKLSGAGELDIINHYGTSPTFAGFLFAANEAVANKLSLWTGQTWVSSTAAVNDGLKHHVVGTLTGNTARLYIDGALDAPGTVITPTLTGVTHALEIGRRYDIATYSGATLGKIALYNTALTLAQVSAHYTAGLGTN